MSAREGRGKLPYSWRPASIRLVMALGCRSRSFIRSVSFSLSFLLLVSVELELIWKPTQDRESRWWVFLKPSKWMGRVPSNRPLNQGLKCNFTCQQDPTAMSSHGTKPCNGMQPHAHMTAHHSTRNSNPYPYCHVSSSNNLAMSSHGTKPCNGMQPHAHMTAHHSTRNSNPYPYCHVSSSNNLGLE
ncbi:disease resistance protein [Striga asiatica]|uniref:Disease resistance protein n=1 Tax=Striga asiatica TaxID=4170 RepID=A0A5A7Q6P9_STRAF|nr:disease resistance protein [Striga asiatica]